MVKIRQGEPMRWHKKGGGSDIFLITVLVIIFVSVGVILPYFRADLEGRNDNYIGSFESDINSEAGSITGIEVVFSVGKMFFWTFGDLPFVLDMVFLVLRILLLVLVYRLIRSGAG
jgi:hypothetical protein